MMDVLLRKKERPAAGQSAHHTLAPPRGRHSLVLISIDRRSPLKEDPIDGPRRGVICDLDVRSRAGTSAGNDVVAAVSIQIARGDGNTAGEMRPISKEAG